jgi:hypothetical protein
MSKEVKFTAKIKNPEQNTLDGAIRNMVKALKGEILTANSFKIWGTTLNKVGTCVKLPGMAYPVDVFIEGGQIKLHGDEMDMRRIQQSIEQFYKVTYMERQVMTLAPSLSGLRTDVNYDQKQEKARLEVAWF